MKRRMRQWISAVMFLSVIIVNASTVLASEPEYQVPSAVNEEEIVEETGPIEEAAVTEEIMPREDASTEETVSEENTDLISENDMGLTANSWRYQNGQPIYNSAPEGRILSSEPYHENATRKGIDVSQWQGEIDWEKVKASGIDYAIIRCGWGMNDEGQDDPMWLRNVSECERLGIPFGVYIYSYATNTERAKSEAEHVLRLVQGHRISYPIFYDMEDRTTASLGNDTLANIADTFCTIIKNAGYAVGVYANLNWWNTKLTDGRFSQWYRWVAQWGPSCTYTGEYTMWQYSEEGRVPGIATNVDMNYLIGYPKDHGESYVGKYQDISGSEWFVTAVDMVVEADVMDGITETQFGPYYNLTRGQMVTSLWQLCGKPEIEYTDTFPDVPDGQSYTQAVLWASKNGIIGGYSNGYFGPDDSITREQLAKIIYDYAQFKGCITTARVDLSGYQDASQISDFAEDAMEWIVSTELIRGKSNDTLLDPQGVTSRAEMAVILQRFMEPFADVKYADWYAENVSLVYLSNLMTGTSEKIFSATDTLPRAQFALIVYRMAGSPNTQYKEVFPDVLETEWYAQAVSWASENGIITGYNSTGNFGPNDFINREQLATMLFRYAQKQGYDTGNRTDLGGFPDRNTVNDFALEAMQWCVAQGIITGDNGNLSPLKTASRAECAAMLMRFLQTVEK